MRELKFRAWDKKEKKFILYFDLYQNPIYWADKMRADYIIQQYTGLKDKNGKEIYRGDIVLVTPVGWIDKEHECESCRQYKIEVKDILDEMKKEIRCQPFFHSYRELEVIGNIYENALL